MCTQFYRQYHRAGTQGAEPTARGITAECPEPVAARAGRGVVCGGTSGGGGEGGGGSETETAQRSAVDQWMGAPGIRLNSLFWGGAWWECVGVRGSAWECVGARWECAGMQLGVRGGMRCQLSVARARARA
jgi:hypothetical protein